MVFFDYFIFYNIYSTISYIEPQWNSSVNKDWVVAIFVLKKEGFQGQCQLFACLSVCLCEGRETEYQNHMNYYAVPYVRQNFCWSIKDVKIKLCLSFVLSNIYCTTLTVNSILLIKLTKPPYLCRLMAVAVNTLKPY